MWQRQTPSSGTAADDTPKKHNVPPKRKLPDFSQPCSKDNPFLSGDESDNWEAEEENIVAEVAQRNMPKELRLLFIQSSRGSNGVRLFIGEYRGGEGEH